MKTNTLVSQEAFLEYVLDSMGEMLIVLDTSLHVAYMNDTAKRMLRVRGDTYVGLHFFKDLRALIVPRLNRPTIVEEVLQDGRPRHGIHRKLATGREVLLNVVPLCERGGEQVCGVLITGHDITDLARMERELDLAFSLTLPNSKVEHKLKNTPEFADKFDPATGRITILKVIEDGGYRHVVNALRIFAAMRAQGVTHVIGIDKDVLVQTIIFHDLGKSQPNLKPGDVVDPREVFEDGKLHAYRSAEIAANFYHLPADAVEIIRYHHHGEHQLPESFPWRLRPMFRLFQVIDGLSAAVTRGGVDVDFELHDCTLRVTEVNARPQYNGTWEIDLFTGARHKLE
ncbi:PAS domain-containing protein [Alicyclobacillus sp.]|uniref:PAS domain-containing protein n=1 Tax=Alicyclobacillus sp. TaxID=61169 RepID=UPI0025C5D430|nr:PAS domain-containing protein [Alicyclobacillus sp.]MCL6517808.1 PAS domain-containing protein [Alicyclobacillus sp.]